MSANKLLRVVVVAASFTAAVSATRTADAGPAAFGLRGGITDDIDTVFFGVHAAIHPSALPVLRVEPSLELGVGDAVDFALRFNVNFKYMIVLGARQAVYPLFGPSLHYVDFDNGGDSSEFGLNLGGGFALYGISFDLALGVGDIPDVTFTIGYTFW